jgi:hypothetical protein
MRTPSSLMALVAAGALAGCGPTAVESTVPATGENHGGVLIPLTDNQAYLELLNGKRQKKGKTYEANLEAYLLQPDRKSAFDRPPTSVEVRIGTPSGEKTVALKAEPVTTDPLGSTRFVSDFGPYELNQGGGDVTVKLGDKALTGTFRGPR